MSALRSKFHTVLLLALSPAPVCAFDLFADLLVWQPSEETSLLWASVLSYAPGDIEVFEGADLTFDWDVGFRVGGGHVFDCDCWDVKLYYTWFRSQGSRSLTEGDELIESQFFGGFLNNDVSESAKAMIKLNYNMFDGQLGREFCITECLSLRPFIGIKGGWIDQSLKSEWQIIDFQTFTTFPGAEDLTNDFWGVGPSVGVDSKWALGCYFSLFGDFETAFLWGTWKNRDLYQNALSRVINTNMKNAHAVSLMLRAFVGVGWERDFFCCTHFAVKAGYEAQIWFSQFRIPTFQQLRVHGDLTLQGGTLNVSFEF